MALSIFSPAFSVPRVCRFIMTAEGQDMWKDCPMAFHMPLMLGWRRCGKAALRSDAIKLGSTQCTAALRLMRPE